MKRKERKAKQNTKPKCTHIVQGKYSYYIEDNRVDTDRGLQGELNYYCEFCGEDITGIVEYR